MRYSVFRCLLGTLVLGLLPLTAIAQPTPLGGEFRVNTTTSLNQSDPQVAMDAAGNFVVVWRDGDYTTGGLDGSSHGIVVQRYDSSGSPIGGEVVVNTDTAGSQNEPAIDMDADGNYVVVWTDTAEFGGDGDGDGDGIAGRLFASDGRPVGPQFQVNSLTTFQQTRAKVAMSDAGGFVVTWGTFGDYDAELFARRFDSAGNPISGDFQVNTTAPYRQYRADVDFDADGDFVILWRNDVDDDEDSDIYARLYDSAGNPQTDEFLLNTYTTGEQRNVSVSMGAGGEFVAAWQSEQDGSSRSVVAQRFDSAGNALGGEIQVNTYTSSSQANPSVAMDANGNFSVVWASFRQDGDGRGVFGQQFDNTGTPVGGEFQVITCT